MCTINHELSNAHCWENFSSKCHLTTFYFQGSSYKQFNAVFRIFRAKNTKFQYFAGFNQCIFMDFPEEIFPHKTVLHQYRQCLITKMLVVQLTVPVPDNIDYTSIKHRTDSLRRMKKHQERRKHCALAEVRCSPKFLPCRKPLPWGTGWPKFNQLEMVTTFTYKPSLVRIDACNLELSW